jgi:hypothetical protein
MKSQLPHLKAKRASAKRPLGLIAIAARNDRVLCTRVVPNYLESNELYLTSLRLALYNVSSRCSFLDPYPASTTACVNLVLEIEMSRLSRVRAVLGHLGRLSHAPQPTPSTICGFAHLRPTPAPRIQRLLVKAWTLARITRHGSSSPSVHAPRSAGGVFVASRLRSNYLSISSGDS